MLRGLVLALVCAHASALTLPTPPGFTASATRRAASPAPALNNLAQQVCSLALCAALTLSPLVAPHALAVSGGGKDFSGASIEGEDFSGQNLKGKEFRGAFAKGANFKGANLAATSFFKAEALDADFSGADLTGASLEEAGLEGAILDQAVMTNAYLSKTIADVKSAKGADFSEAVLPPYAQKSLCASGVGGTNEKTGVATRDSLMCPD